MGFRVVTAPTCEPVTLNEVRLYLRMPDADHADDDTITQLITAARQHAESRMRRQIVQATLEYTLDQFPVGHTATITGAAHQRTSGIRLPHPPLISVTSVKYIDAAGAEQTLASTVYAVDAKAEPGVVMLAFDKSWPVIRAQASAITITYLAGYGAATDTTDLQKQAAVPAAVKLAVKMLVAHWYDAGRTPVNVGNIASDLAHTLDAILAAQGYGSYYE